MLILAGRYMSSKEVQDYTDLCRKRDLGQILTPDGLIFICDAFHYDPEAIGRHFIEMAVKFKTIEEGEKVYE